MSNTEINAAKILFRHLEDASLITAYDLEIAWPNVNYTPTVGTTYLDVDIIPVENVNIGIADGSTTEFQGILQIAVMAPLGGGIITPMEIAGAIADRFERNASITGEGLTVKIEGRPVFDSYLQDGDRIRLPVRVKYFVLA